MQEVHGGSADQRRVILPALGFSDVRESNAPVVLPHSAVCVVVHSTVEIPVEVVEALPHRVVARVAVPQVPLAEHRAQRYAPSLHHLGQDVLLPRHPRLDRGEHQRPLHPPADRIPSGHQRHARRAAHRGGVELIEDGAIRGEIIDSRRPGARVGECPTPRDVVVPDIPVPHVVYDDDDDVGWLQISPGEGERLRDERKREHDEKRRAKRIHGSSP